MKAIKQKSGDDSIIWQQSTKQACVLGKKVAKLGGDGEDHALHLLPNCTKQSTLL